MSDRETLEAKGSSGPGETGEFSAPQRFQGGPVFWGPNGLRAGWRILIAATIWLALLIGIGSLVSLIPGTFALLRTGTTGGGQQTPATLLIIEAISLGATLLTMLAMTKIEERTFAEYYLPWSAAFGRRFWQGLAYGLTMVSLMMGLIAAFHGFSLGSLALNPGATIRYGGLYAVTFFLVGLFEESTFRGYLQAALGSGIGFWPAALVLAAVFGGSHLSNPGEARYGALMAGCFGLLVVFTLRRTGNLWFAIGMHSAWDWGESFLYSVPDSGLVVHGHLLNSTSHGPVWLTGGTVGPEASVFCFVVLFVAAVGVHFLFPEAQNSKALPFEAPTPAAG
jgi:uncharacterized protein